MPAPPRRKHHSPPRRGTRCDGTHRPAGSGAVARAGPGGGRGARAGRRHPPQGPLPLPPPLGLSLGEALRLALSHKLSAALGAIPAGGTLDLAILKLSAGLPRNAGLRLAGLLRRVVVGRPPSTALCAESGAVRPSVYAACEEAFVQSCELDLVYVDGHGATSRRRIQPHGLLVQAPLWYLLAWDPAKQAGRMFRLDRIRSARSLGSRGFEPLDPRKLFAEIGRFGLELS